MLGTRYTDGAANTVRFVNLFIGGFIEFKIFDVVTVYFLRLFFRGEFPSEVNFFSTSFLAVSDFLQMPPGGYSWQAPV